MTSLIEDPERRTPNQENIRKWVNELRSGTYPQAQGHLAAETSEGLAYCCLGVACVAAGLKAEEHEDEYFPADEPNIEPTKWFQFAEAEGTLPDRVQTWLGLSEADPHLKMHDGAEYTAVHLNDELHADFKEIADAIERTYLDD